MTFYYVLCNWLRVCSIQRKYGLGLTGKRVSRKGNFTRGTRFSVLAAMSSDGVKASHVIVGSYNRVQFDFAMEHFVLPHVGSYAANESCSVIVFDNCSIHRSERVLELIRQRGGISVFLPYVGLEFKVFLYYIMSCINDSRGCTLLKRSQVDQKQIWICPWNIVTVTAVVIHYVLLHVLPCWYFDLSYPFWNL